MTRPLTPNNESPERSGWTWQDGLLILAIIALIFIIIKTAANFNDTYNPNLKIDTHLSVLPSYTAQTLMRMTIAYFLSLGFSISYSYVAYRFAFASKILIPLLDILQSIPVLSFLPGVVLALITLFPERRLGVELSAVLLIFTGMTWNMTFSFYQSLCNIPKELLEAAQVYRLNDWQRFWTVELPSGVIGLVWNSVMSVAGGWFFLIQIERFTLGNQNFQLPGLGSFLGTAANEGNFSAIMTGLAVLISIVIAIDFFIWRPLIAWAEKFKLEMVESTNIPKSTVLDFIRRSPTLRIFSERIWTPLKQSLDHRTSPNPTHPRLPTPNPTHPRLPTPNPSQEGNRSQEESQEGNRSQEGSQEGNRSQEGSQEGNCSQEGSQEGKGGIQNWLNWLFLSGFAFIVLWGTWEAVLLLQKLSLTDWQRVMSGAIFTALRVLIALILSLLWTVPVGVAIGRNPRLAQILQPIVQIAASVPATALFPVLLLYLVQIGGGLEVGSIVLMMLGTMWYILFNVIAGAQSIPSELFEAAKVYKLSLIQRWQTLILPGIFPYLVTGIITAVGGAWNASIAGEYIQFRQRTLTTPGLGEIITDSSEHGNFALLLGATIVMSLLVVLTNRLVWRRLYKLAQEKYQLL